MDKHVIKQNSYTNPIDDLTFLDHLIFNFKLLTFLDHLIFNFKLLFFIISTIPLISISFFLGNFVKPIQNYLSILFHKLLLWLLSVKVETEGHIDRAKDCNLFVSNHISYLDVPILGSNFPLRFVAKSEVASWNLFGFLAKLARTIFIKRNRHDTISQKNKIKKALLLKEQVLIFPEGTTSDGNRVLGFKSSLLSAVEKEDFLIQPITLLYSEINGIPVNRWLRPVIAWYGDMELRPHLSSLVSLRPIKVRLIFSDPVNSKLFSNRKDLNKFLEKIIKTNYNSVISK